MKCTKKKKSIYYNRNSEFIGYSDSDFANDEHQPMDI